MTRVKPDFGRFAQRRVVFQMSMRHGSRLIALATLAVLLGAGMPVPGRTQQPGQQTFPSAQAAISGLVAALQANDEQAMLRILGPDARRIVSSGDPVEDRHNRENFVQRYLQMHRMVNEPDGTTSVYVGAANWPMPIPLAHTGRVWYFDTDAGKREILYRRIGRNELSAIRVCEELAAAEKQYYAMRGAYAEKIYSDPGRHDGLYWKSAAGEPQSPIGPLIASAVAAGYTPSGSGAPTPYRGYYYHVLTGQGPSAPGGAKSYRVSGKMTGGFAFVAYPAEYRSSGVMTFLVSGDGVVVQKDLGRNTVRLGSAMRAYDPDASWQKTETEAESAAEQPSR
jgi:hypothetical protein